MGEYVAIHSIVQERFFLYLFQCQKLATVVLNASQRVLHETVFSGRSVATCCAITGSLALGRTVGILVGLAANEASIVNGLGDIRKGFFEMQLTARCVQ